MYPQVITQSLGNATGPAYFDIMRTPFNVSIGAEVTGTINYTIQHTFEDLMSTLVSNAVWWNNDNASLTSASTSQTGNYAYAVRAARVIVNSGTGSVKVTFLQAGIPGG